MIDMIPRRKENVDRDNMTVNRLKLCEITLRGTDPYVGADLFVKWFESLELYYKKQIMPLAYNWPFIKDFLFDWLGPLSFNMCFHQQYRDLLPAALIRNDRAGWSGNDFPFPKLTFGYFCSQLRIIRTGNNQAEPIEDARVVAEIYRRMIQEFL